MNRTVKDGLFRVLCLDGGGMRGLYTAILLDTIVRQLSGGEEIDIGTGFDLIVGTSTGGILATGLALGVPIESIIALYKENGVSIFPEKSNIEKKFPKTSFFKNILSKNPAQEKSQRNLKAALDARFKEKTIEDLWKEREIALCIPTVHMETQNPWIFKTPHAENLKLKGKYKLSDICLATCAAPVFFPLAIIDEPEGNGYRSFADGGLWCNNPSIVGLIEALEMTSEKKQDIQIISIGTASPASGRPISKDGGNLSLISEEGWGFGRRIVEVCIESQTSATERQLSFIIKHMNENIKDFNIDVLRLPNGDISPDQAELIGLDKSDEKALNTLINMAESDGLTNILGRDSKLSDDELKTLKQIVNTMKPHLETNYTQPNQ